MKELSIEEKAKAYDKAIERAESIYNETAIPSATTKGICTYIFPELKESEEENTGKAVLKAFKIFAEKQAYVGHCLDDIDWDKCIAWIEKQGEQKPTDTVEPSVFKDRLLELLQRFRWRCKDHVLTNGEILEYVDAHIQELIGTIQNTWSEEDEEIYKKCICAMRASACGFPEEEKFVEQVDNWLKSLKERYTWKPSDEQMDALHTYIYNPQHFSSPDPRMELVESVYKDLKKLREG